MINVGPFFKSTTGYLKIGVNNQHNQRIEWDIRDQYRLS